MNFISCTASPKSQLELKYCERCGALWLRPQGGSEVYCSLCQMRMAELARPTQGRRSKRPRLPSPQPEDLQGQVQIEYLQAVTEVRP
jgi:uncharacterized Zn finger protein (UPF0148 family)